MHDLHDRGFIQAGKAADICIFDPDTIGMKPREPMYEFPGGEMHVKQPANGIDYVIVNGEVLLENGEHTGALPGQVLRGPYHQDNKQNRGACRIRNRSRGGFQTRPYGCREIGSDCLLWVGAGRGTLPAAWRPVARRPPAV